MHDYLYYSSRLKEAIPSPNNIRVKQTLFQQHMCQTNLMQAAAVRDTYVRVSNLPSVIVTHSKIRRGNRARLCTRFNTQTAATHAPVHAKSQVLQNEAMIAAAGTRPTSCEPPTPASERINFKVFIYPQPHWPHLNGGTLRCIPPTPLGTCTKPTTAIHL